MCSTSLVGGRDSVRFFPSCCSLPRSANRWYINDRYFLMQTGTPSTPTRHMGADTTIYTSLPSQAPNPCGLVRCIICYVDVPSSKHNLAIHARGVKHQRLLKATKAAERDTPAPDTTQGQVNLELNVSPFFRALGTSSRCVEFMREPLFHVEAM